MPYKQLPSNPSLDHLKYQAKDLQRAIRAHEPQAFQRVREFHPRFFGFSDDQIVSGPFNLADAQLAIAREFCFPSWPKLKVAVSSGATSDNQVPFEDRIEDHIFRQAVDLLDSGDESGLHALLEAHPQVVRQRVFFSISDYFGNPCLLEFVAENPIRHDTLPLNIVAIAKVILDAGAVTDKRGVTGTLALVVSGKVPRECGVQVALIDLLCDYGADPARPMLAALGHGEFEAVEAEAPR